MAVKVFDADSSTTLLDELVAKIRDGLSRAGQKLISEYHARMKTVEAQRNLKSFNFLSFFALKEGLGLVYEAMRSPSAALGIYDELELLFGQRNLESWRPNFSSFGGNELGDDSGSLLDFTKKPYRQLLLSGKLTEFDFRQYLFSRQAHLLFILANPSHVLLRGIKFIASFEESMTQAACTRLFIDVWAFSAFMDLAEACKATNQSLNNDKSINNILGDAYHSAMSRLDSLGAEFDFLPSESQPFIVGAPDPVEPIIDEAEGTEDVHDVHVEPSAFTSPLKASDKKLALSRSNGLPALPSTTVSTAVPASSPRIASAEAHDEDEGPADSMSLGHAADDVEPKKPSDDAEPKHPSEEPKVDPLPESAEPTPAPSVAEAPVESAEVPAPEPTTNDAPVTTEPPVIVIEPATPTETREETTNSDSTPEETAHTESAPAEPDVKTDPPQSQDDAPTPQDAVVTPQDAVVTPQEAALPQEEVPAPQENVAPADPASKLSALTSQKSAVDAEIAQLEHEIEDINRNITSHFAETPSEASALADLRRLEAKLSSLQSSTASLTNDILDIQTVHDEPAPKETEDDHASQSSNDSEVHAADDTLPQLGGDDLTVSSETPVSTVEDSTPQVTQEDDGTTSAPATEQPASLDAGNETFLVPAIPVASVTKPSAPASPSKPRSSHNRNKSGKARSRTHSRNSSIGEDIFLGDVPVDTNPGFSLDEALEEGLADLAEDEGDGARVSSFPELQMSLLASLKEETVRNALIKSLNLSEADSMMVKDPSNGAVFSLQYMQSCDYISDSSARKLLDSLDASDPALEPLRVAATSFERSRARSSQTTPLPAGAPDLHPSASAPIVSSANHIESTAPLFAFTRVINSADQEPVPSTSASNTPTKVSAPSAATTARQLRHTVSTPALSASTVEQLKPKRHMHFHTKALLPSRDTDGADVVNLQIDGITITHPSLSSALVSAHDFDKLYKTVALKSNEAFVSVHRARASTRIKNALGNLAFARGHYAETLKFFDEALISVYITEGWDRMVFTIYNKIAECYLRLGQIAEYCAALTCLLVPRLLPFASEQQRLNYQQEFIRAAAVLPTPLPITIDPLKPIDKLLQLRVAVLSPQDKSPQSALKAINALVFSMGDTVTLRATVHSEFPHEIVADKFYVTFEATNPKTYKTRTFHVGSSKLTLQPGSQTVSMRAQFSKGLWVLASYSITVGKVTVTTRYKHPGPVETKTALALTVISSATNARVKVVAPNALALRATQFLHVSIESGDDTMKEAMMMLLYDSNAVVIPDGRLPAKLTRTIVRKAVAAAPAGSTSPRKKSKSEAHASKHDEVQLNVETDQAPTESVVMNCEVLIGNHAISLPEIPKRSVLEFYLPITSSATLNASDGKIQPKNRDIQMDLTYRKLSNEKKTVATVTSLKFEAPLTFDYSIMHNDSGSLSTSGDHYFVTATITNVSPYTIRITTHSTITEGPIVLTQDYAAALNADQVELATGDFTTLLFGVHDTSRPASSSRRRPSSGIIIDGSEPKPVSSWIGLSIQSELLSNLNERSEPISAAYDFTVPFVAPSARYKVGLNFDKEATVGLSSKMMLDIYLPPDSSRSTEFASFYRVLFDPAQWVITGRTYGKIKGGYTDAILSIVALTATATPPTIQIEEFSNIKDSKSKSIVPSAEVALRYSHTSFTILPPNRITGVCREILEH